MLLMQALEAEDLDVAEGCALRVIQLLPHATLPQVLFHQQTADTLRTTRSALYISASRDSTPSLVLTAMDQPPAAV